MSQRTRQAQAPPLGARSNVPVVLGRVESRTFSFKIGFVRLRLNSFCNKPVVEWQTHSRLEQ